MRVLRAKKNWQYGANVTPMKRKKWVCFLIACVAEATINVGVARTIKNEVNYSMVDAVGIAGIRAVVHSAISWSTGLTRPHPAACAHAVMPLL